MSKVYNKETGREVNALPEQVKIMIDSGEYAINAPELEEKEEEKEVKKLGKNNK